MTWNEFTKKVKAFLTGKKSADQVDTSPYAEGEKQLNEKLGELEEEYEKNKDYDVGKGYEDLADLLPEKQTFEYLKYEGDDADTIREKTQSEFDKLLGEEKKKVNDTYDTKAQAAESKKDAANTEYAQDKARIEAEYADFQKALEQELIKKGLYRSSITKSSKDANDRFRQSELNVLSNKLAANVSAIDAEIEKLRGEESVALQGLDISYAQKLQQEIERLLDKRSREIESIDKYNNTLKEKESKYIEERTKAIEAQLAKRQKDELEIKGLENKYGYAGEKLKSYKERYEIAYEYYSSIPKEAALQMLDANKDLQGYLGKYYSKLLGDIAKK